MISPRRKFMLTGIISESIGISSIGQSRVDRIDKGYLASIDHVGIVSALSTKHLGPRQTWRSSCRVRRSNRQDHPRHVAREIKEHLSQNLNAHVVLVLRLFTKSKCGSDDNINEIFL